MITKIVHNIPFTVYVHFSLNTEQPWKFLLFFLRSSQKAGVFQIPERNILKCQETGHILQNFEL